MNKIDMEKDITCRVCGRKPRYDELTLGWRIYVGGKRPKGSLFTCPECHVKKDA